MITRAVVFLDSAARFKISCEITVGNVLPGFAAAGTGFWQEDGVDEGSGVAVEGGGVGGGETGGGGDAGGGGGGAFSGSNTSRWMGLRRSTFPSSSVARAVGFLFSLSARLRRIALSFGGRRTPN